jgi:hypothetical protein
MLIKQRYTYLCKKVDLLTRKLIHTVLWSISKRKLKFTWKVKIKVVLTLVCYVGQITWNLILDVESFSFPQSTSDRYP